MVVPPSVIWRLVFVEIKVMFCTLFKNSNMRINTLTWQLCSLTDTCKSTICSSDELDSDTWPTPTFNLSSENLPLFSSLLLLLLPSLPDKSLISGCFLMLSFSISATKDIMVSFAVVRIVALLFWTTKSSKTSQFFFGITTKNVILLVEKMFGSYFHPYIYIYSLCN